jgi:DNA-binding CsgD family transcriptional regulator
VLPACVEIELAAGDRDAARRACSELESRAPGGGPGALAAIAAHARGAVELASGRPAAALAPLRRAVEEWQRLEAPYEVARVRDLVGLACRALGDEDAAALELGAARAVYEQLGARLDLARADSLPAPALGDAHGLTRREREVLRLIATGATNKAIAAELVLSERTVDRHVSNILAKLRVSSRVAATGYAYKHGLLGERAG